MVYYAALEESMWFLSAKFMGRGKAVLQAHVLYFNERWEENRRDIIFIFHTTFLPVVHNFYFPYNLVISEYLRGTT